VPVRRVCATAGFTLRSGSPDSNGSLHNARFTKQIVFANRQVYALDDAFSASHLQVSGGHSSFSVDGRPGLPYGLHNSQPREFRPAQRFDDRLFVDQCVFALSEFSRAEPAGPDGRNGELPSSFRRQRSGKTQRPQARSRRRDVVLSCGSYRCVETEHSDAANFPRALLRSAISFRFGAGSLPPRSRICSAPLAQRQRHTPRKPPASHLDITLQVLPAFPRRWHPIGRQKTILIFQGENP
jgi:hypothetical protein